MYNFQPNHLSCHVRQLAGWQVDTEEWGRQYEWIFLETYFVTMQCNVTTQFISIDAFLLRIYSILPAS